MPTVIPLFVGYALLVWFFAARHRRQVLGFVCVLSGTLALAAVGLAHYEIGRRIPGLYMQNMQVILYPYTLLVLVIGVYIACMPRPRLLGACGGCGYSLAGLAPDSLVCPECGRPLHDGPTRSYRPSGTGRGSLRSTDVRTVDWPDHPRSSLHASPASSTPSGTPATSPHRTAESSPADSSRIVGVASASGAGATRSS
jgi:hypothetical protein